MSLDNFFNVNVEHKDYMSWNHRTVMPLLSCNSSDAQERILTSTRVMLIRHPFHRLASAFQFIFRFSIQETESKYFEHQASLLLSQGIIEQLRPGSANPQITFSEFVRFILDEKKKGDFSSPIHQKGLEKWPGGEWSEFGQHWQSISNFCSPCTFLPHLVLEVDNLSKEFPFVLEWSGLSRLYGHFPDLPRDNAGLVRGKNLARSLFRELEQSEIIELAEFYQDDFILGGYPPNILDL